MTRRKDREHARSFDQAKPGGVIGEVFDRCSLEELLRASRVDPRARSEIRRAADAALIALARRVMDPTPIDPMRQRRSWLRDGVGGEQLARPTAPSTPAAGRLVIPMQVIGLVTNTTGGPHS